MPFHNDHKNVSPVHLVKLISALSVCLILHCRNPPEKITPKTEHTPQHVQKHAKGIDLSHHSGSINWDEINKSEISFVFCKATEGEDWQDPLFVSYFEQFQQHSIPKGAYHFYIVGDDPEKQALNFINTVSVDSIDLPPVVDIETMHKHNDPRLVKDLMFFLRKLETHYHKKPMIYTGLHFWNKHFHDTFAPYKLWLAEYDVETPSIPEGWTEWCIWQTHENQPLPGIQNGVDINIFNGNINDFEAFIENTKVK
jgi:lysozyme